MGNRHLTKAPLFVKLINQSIFNEIYLLAKANYTFKIIILAVC